MLSFVKLMQLGLSFMGLSFWIIQHHSHSQALVLILFEIDTELGYRPYPMPFHRFFIFAKLYFHWRRGGQPEYEKLAKLMLS